MTAPAETHTGDFADFVTARSARLLRVAYLLTRDWALAEDLLQTSLAKAWTAWRRIEGDPEPYVRRILVNTYTSWWRRRWHHERPTDELPERPGPDPHRGYDDRDQLARALGRLPRQQRAVLVLRYYEDLSEAQIADVLGISPGTVKSHAAKAIARLRIDPELTGLEPDSEPPAGVARLAAVSERIQQARTRRVATVGSACAVILALLLGYALNPVHRGGPDPVASAGSREINGFPEYQMGTRLVATGTVTSEAPQAILTWPASTSDIVVFVRCGGSVVDAQVAFSTERAPIGSTACRTERSTSAGGGTGVSWPQEALVTAGVVAGATISMTARLSSTGGKPAKPGVRVDVAIGERVPWSAYPFPPRPTALGPLDPSGLDHVPGAVRLQPPDEDPAQPVGTSLVWGKPFTVHFSQRAPGILHLRVANVEVTSCGSWDYVVSGCRYILDPGDVSVAGRLPRLRPGDVVRIEVAPDNVLAGWAVWLAPTG